MYIKSLTFEDKAAGWKLEKVEFDRLSLLVGLSGAGKTRILNAIKSLVEIALFGASYQGLKWEIHFTDNENRDVIWNGETAFNSKNHDSERSSFLDPIYQAFTTDADKRAVNNFINEIVIIDGQDVVKRENGSIHLNGEETPKLPNTQSVLYLLREVNDLVYFYTSFYHTRIANVLLDKEHFAINDEAFDMQIIRLFGVTPLNMLLHVFYLDKQLFNDIKSTYQEIFPYVEDIRFVEQQKIPGGMLYTLEIKEYGCGKWINIHSVSSGMVKALQYLSSIYLSSENSVFLIDEIENSFGVNCLEPVVELIMSRSNAQFIITSHHPYIINNIEPENWMLVEKHADVIKTSKVEDRISKVSKHDKFMLLSNLLEDLKDEHN